MLNAEHQFNNVLRGFAHPRELIIASSAIRPTP